MPSEIDRLTLAEEVARLQRDEAHRWTVRLVDGTLTAYVTMMPVGFTDRYCLRIDFGEQLSSGPPSVSFCNPETGAEGRPEDWPKGNTDYFKPPPGHMPGWICSQWTREGRQQHAEWRDKGWRTNRAIWRVATAMQDILDKPGAYIGRLAA